MEAVSNKFEIQRVSKSRIQEVDFTNIPFGRHFSDHMFVADYSDGVWEPAKIVPYDKLSIYPSISALHYGQSIFEGLKAFKTHDNRQAIFRPDANFDRMNLSAERLCMPKIPEEYFLGGMYELVRLDNNWIPTSDGSSLYIRPFYFATDEYIGIRPSSRYKFIIFTCPVGAYYPEPVRLLVTREYVRAFPGGTGNAKAAGNYAASLLGARKALDAGYHNVLWLDGKEHKYVEECGTMNIFFVVNGTVITPKLGGTILRGITRDSVIQWLRHKNIAVEERKVSVDELREAYEKGKFQEAFGTGTAATIAPVDRIGLDGEDMILPPVKERPISTMLVNDFSLLRKGQLEDSFGWMKYL